MVDAVVFDIDGTLLDSVNAHADVWKRVLEEFGRTVSVERLRQEIGKEPDQILRAVFPEAGFGEVRAAIERRRRELFSSHGWAQVRPFPGIRELMARLRQDGTRIALSCSAPADVVRVNLGVAFVGDLVDAVSSGDDVAGEHEGGALAVALAKLGNVRRNETWVVGDTPRDAEAAASLGLATIGLCSGAFTCRELLAAGCSAVYDDPLDLLLQYATSPLALAAPVLRPLVARVAQA